MIGIRGIRFESVAINPKAENDDPKVTGTYALMSTADKVLAKQGFNGYSEIKVAFSPPTIKKLDEFLAAMKAEIGVVLGLDEEGK